MRIKSSGLAGWHKPNGKAINFWGDLSGFVILGQPIRIRISKNARKESADPVDMF
jgi:hypothetical protein